MYHACTQTIRLDLTFAIIALYPFTNQARNVKETHNQETHDDQEDIHGRPAQARNKERSAPIRIPRHPYFGSTSRVHILLQQLSCHAPGIRHGRPFTQVPPSACSHGNVQKMFVRPKLVGICGKPLHHLKAGLNPIIPGRLKSTSMTTTGTLCLSTRCSRPVSPGPRIRKISLIHLSSYTCCHRAAQTHFSRRSWRLFFCMALSSNSLWGAQAWG